MKTISTFKFLYLILFLSLIMYSWVEPRNMSADEKQVAYMVIANGSKNKEIAQKQLTDYKKQGLPWYNTESERYNWHEYLGGEAEFPKVILSDEVEGLNPGFWIVVTLISKDKSVASRYNSFLRSLGVKSYIREVKMETVYEIQLLEVFCDKIDLSCEELCNRAKPYLNNLSFIVCTSQQCPYNKAGCGYTNKPRGGCLLFENNRALIPYYLTPWEGDQMYMSIKYYHPERKFPNGICEHCELIKTVEDEIIKPDDRKIKQYRIKEICVWEREEDSPDGNF